MPWLRVNPDERTRRAERSWQESGDAHAAAAWLTGLARSRELHADPAGVLPALEVLVRADFQGLPFDPLVELIVARARAGKTLSIRWDHTLAEAGADEDEVEELFHRGALLSLHLRFPGVEAVRWAEILCVPDHKRLGDAASKALRELGTPGVSTQAVTHYSRWGAEPDLPAAVVNASSAEGWNVFNDDEIQSADWNPELVDRLVREYIRAHGIFSPAPEYAAELVAELGTDYMAYWQVKQSAFLGYPHALVTLYFLKMWAPESYQVVLGVETGSQSTTAGPGSGWRQAELDLAVALLGGPPLGRPGSL